MKQEFNWGDSPPSFINAITQEIFTNNCYEEILSVKEGDIVLDLGASIGPFTWSVMDKASRVYAIEPISTRRKLIETNTKGYPVEIIKGIIHHSDGEVYFEDGCLPDGGEKVETFTFKTFLEKNNIKHIDFIKTDCEGGEYQLFRDENMPFLLNNVRDITGEFHLGSPYWKTEFRYWRDKYLNQFPYFEVRSIDGMDIKWDLWNDHFIEYYNEVHFHISNGH